MKKFVSMVPGSKGDEFLEVSSPYDGKLIGSVPVTDEQGAEQALKNASELFSDPSRWLSADKRINVLARTAELMEENLEELVQIALLEGGKPYSDTKVEVERAIDGVKNCVECIRTSHGKEIPMRINPASENRLAMTTLEPIGVVVAISAFNHPLNLIVHQVGPAVASGCPVIVKPASDTALSCFRFVELLRQAGLPDSFCQPVATTETEVAELLVTDKRVAFFSFIGSAKVGWMLKSKLAPGTRCALEHGGVAPAIVTEDADMDAALPLLTKGGFYHAGQVCVSVQRVYVHESIVENFADRFVELVRALKVGDPADPETDVGPLIRHQETERVSQWVEDAKAQGATILCGGKKLSDALYEPTVLLNPPLDATISQSEIFGPVVCLYTYSELEDAIEKANDLPFAFQASVMTQNLDKALFAYKRLSASAVMVNDHTAFRVDWMPFAGLKQSGYGVGGIPYTFHDMQIEKMLVVKSSSL